MQNYQYPDEINITFSCIMYIDPLLNKKIINKPKLIHEKRLHWPGIEPGPPAWQARILPLNHQCLLFYIKIFLLL